MSALLVLLVGLPLLVAALLLLVPRWQIEPVAVPVGVVTASVTLLASVLLLAARPWQSPDPVAEVDVAWVPTIGVRLHLLVDGIALPLVLLTAVLGLAVMLLLCRQVPGGGSPQSLVAALLAVEGGALAAFTAADLVVFFVAFELVLVPMWAVIRVWGHRPERDEAASRFVLYTALGSVLMLAGLLVVAIGAGTTDVVRLTAAHGTGLDRTTQVAAAVLLVLGLAVKVPVLPLHTWLPPAHTAAPTVGSVLLAGVLLKLGSYGMVRFVVPVVPQGFSAVAPVLGALGAAGVLWGGLVCLRERDLKRLVAYSSVAHTGFVALGIASGTPEGLQGALFLNVAHGAISALLFVVAGALKDSGRTGVGDVGAGLRDRAPRLGAMLAVGCVAGLGLPGLAGFWGELLAVLGSWHGPADAERDGEPGVVFWRALAVLAAVGTALAAAYLLRVLRLVWHGERPDDAPAQPVDDVPEASWADVAVGLPLVVAIAALGLLPSLLLRVTEPGVRAVLEAVRGVV
ncbi:complex I subunit 4 family protein [Angustibacter aerolatus]